MLLGFLIAALLTLLGSSDTADDGETLSAFNRWHKSLSSINDHTLHVENYAEFGNGLVADRDVAEGEPILSIPMAHVLCRDSIMSSPQVQKNRKYIPVYDSITSEGQLIAFHLMRYRNVTKQSALVRWISVLPQSFSYVPSLWKPSYKKLIEPAAVRERIQQMTAAGNSEYESFRRSVLFPATSVLGGDWERRYSKENFQWASFVVNTRAWSLNGRRYLVPVAGMANHAFDAEDFAFHPSTVEANVRSQKFTKLHYIRNGFATALSDRAVAAGEQIFESYGDNRNSIYFDYHGFVPAGNPYECVPLGTAFGLSLPPFPESAITEQRMSLLRAIRELPDPRALHRVGAEVSCVYSAMDGFLNPQLLLWCAVGHAPQGEFATLERQLRKKEPSLSTSFVGGNAAFRRLASALNHKSLRQTRLAALHCVSDWAKRALVEEFSCNIASDGFVGAREVPAAYIAAEKSWGLAECKIPSKLRKTPLGRHRVTAAVHQRLYVLSILLCSIRARPFTSSISFCPPASSRAWKSILHSVFNETTARIQPLSAKLADDSEL